MRRAVPNAVMTTMGHANPSPVTMGSAYRYRGRPGWPFDPASRDGGGGIEAPKGGAKERAAGRERNLRAFTDARAEGLSIIEAGARVGVTRKTAARYEKARLAAAGSTS